MAGRTTVRVSSIEIFVQVSCIHIRIYGIDASSGAKHFNILHGALSKFIVQILYSFFVFFFIVTCIRVHIYVHDMTTTTTTTMYTSYDDGVARKLLSEQRRRPERLVFFINTTYRRPIPPPPPNRYARLPDQTRPRSIDPGRTTSYQRGAIYSRSVISRTKPQNTVGRRGETSRKNKKKYSRLATTTPLSAGGGRCIYHIVYTRFTSHARVHFNRDIVQIRCDKHDDGVSQ